MFHRVLVPKTTYWVGRVFGCMVWGFLHLWVGADTIVLNGNSQFWWVAQPGAHTISFEVDADNHVVESREQNNSVSVQVNVS